MIDNITHILSGFLLAQTEKGLLRTYKHERSRPEERWAPTIHEEGSEIAAKQASLDFV
ncbi:hypothetical protein M2277_003672 [Paenibacillus sp. LBL]|nr:hypothetical protein [Paenibacillus sp. LBL]